MKNNIVLIGMMGAGKSTVAKELAKLLPKYKLIDTDLEIEKEQNLQISEIFEKYSESYFRNLETNYLNNICKNNFQILSTGGGIFEKEENRILLENCGKVFYLKATPEKLFERIQKQTHRPLLNKGFGVNNIKIILDEREANYAKAHYIIDTTNEFLYNIVKNIAEKGSINE